MVALIASADRVSPGVRPRWVVRCLCIGILAVAACTNAVYNRLDTLAGWYLQSLVSLDSDQREELHDWLFETLAWHRRSELNRYAQFLRELSSQLAQPGDLASYERIEARFRGFLDDLAVKTTPEAAQLLLSLSQAQVSELFTNLAAKTRERAEKHADPVEWRRDQGKNLTKQLKRWTGSVSDSQQALIAAAVERLEPTSATWAATQLAWRNAVQQALTGSGARTASATTVQQLLEHPEIQWTPEYAQIRKRNRERYLELAASLDASLSGGQRERLRAELLKLAQQLAKIAEERT
jgi:hypothetical protein